MKPWLPIAGLLALTLALAGCTAEAPEPGAAAPSEKAAMAADPAHATGVVPADASAALATAPVYEVGCASCVFHQEGVDGCQLAIRVDGKLYPVQGATVDDHSICSAVQRARVAGAVEGDAFVAQAIALE